MSIVYIGPSDPDTHPFFNLPCNFNNEKYDSFFHAVCASLSISGPLVRIEDAHHALVSYNPRQRVYIPLLAMYGVYFFQHHEEMMKTMENFPPGTQFGIEGFSGVLPYLNCYHAIALM